MTQEIDIWRSAAMLVKHHGDEAPIHAAMRADELLDAGDIDGQRVWLRILSVVKEQQRDRGDEALHCERAGVRSNRCRRLRSAVPLGGFHLVKP